MTAQSMKARGEITKKLLMSNLSKDPKHPSRLHRRAKVSAEYARNLLAQLVAEGKAEVVKVGRAKHYKLAPRRRAAKKAAPAPQPVTAPPAGSWLAS
jgi:predicted transcriptional regulator